MSVPDLAWTDLGGADTAPLLVLGPSLGTDVRTLWDEVAASLADEWHVVGWDLPGHGASAPATDFTLAEVADAVAAGLAALPGDGTCDYAGVSAGGAVGLHLLVDHPERVRTATLLATGARIGTPEGWHERAALVRSSGTAALLDATPGRWFADPAATSAARATLLASLPEIDADAYAATCEALAAYDVRARLAEVTVPVLAVAGAADAVTTTATLRHVADGVQQGRLVVLAGSAHLPPVEQPAQVADLVRAQLRETSAVRRDRRADGMRVRREVLGDAHVDRASAAVTGLTADFQELITRYAWGEVWTRPGLDRRSRSMITLTALIALGHHDELAMHLRAARTNGLTLAEIEEVILQSAVYCGVPAANTAFRIAQQTLEESP